jgi:hypothetical protein
MIQSLKKKNILWFITLLLLLIYIWFQLPNYLPCSSFSKFGSYEQNGQCIIPNDLLLEGKIDGLPKSLLVKGNLEIRGTSISNFPSHLHVEGNVYLYKTSIGSIPEDTYIGGSFDYYLGFGSPSIYCDEIPSKVVIKGNNGCEH